VVASGGEVSVEGARELYARAQPRIVIQVAALTGQFDVAEEIVQEAFVRCLERWSTVRDYDDPEAWVRKVAFNLARSRWRRLKRGVTAFARLDHRHPHTEMSDDHLMLLSALSSLDDNERDVVVLHHLLDLPIRDVAQRLGISDGVVRSRLSRGRAQLAKKLGSAGEEYADG
jgi:RNA polymerase sigma-70 factor (ECF subfamily)